MGQGARSLRPTNAPPVRIFVMGANKWRDEREWPIARTPVHAVVSRRARHAPTRSMATARSAASRAARDAPDTFLYDPRKPVPTMGGAICCNPKIFPWGPMDQRPVEGRKDVLVYTGEPLERDLEVTGRVRTVLYVSTTAPDTDFTAKLLDVYPDGRAINLCDGMLRLRYRQGLDRAIPAKPGEVYADRDRDRRDQQRVSRRAPHPARGVEQQLPALRPQSQHGHADRGRKTAADGDTDRLSRPAVSVLRVAAGDSVTGYNDRFCTTWRGSQVVRQRSAKPLFSGSNPLRASNVKILSEGLAR